MSRAKDLFEKFSLEGEGAIDEFIREGKSEELFLDFKVSADSGAGIKLHADDRANLAKAISGFGNSEGGLIVWGVSCRNDPKLGDIPTAKAPIAAPGRFVSRLESAVSGCSLPPHGLVQHRAVSGGRPDDGFVLTYVPKSALAPHQCIVEPYKYRYYMRVGSNFDHVPHSVLAGMFGRRPAPQIFHMWENGGAGVTSETNTFVIVSSRNLAPGVVYLNIGFVVRNGGAVVARDLYANVQLGGVSEEFSFNASSPAGWLRYESPAGVHVISPDEFRLAPWAQTTALQLRVDLVPPFTHDLWYEITFGCSGSPVAQIFMTVPVSEVTAAYQAFLAERSKTNGLALARRAFGLDRAQVQSLATE
jgi:hypothetical protein